MSFERALVTIVVVVQVSRVRVISVRDAKSSHSSDPSVSVIASMFGNLCLSASPPLRPPHAGSCARSLCVQTHYSRKNDWLSSDRAITLIFQYVRLHEHVARMELGQMLWDFNSLQKNTSFELWRLSFH